MRPANGAQVLDVCGEKEEGIGIGEVGEMGLSGKERGGQATKGMSPHRASARASARESTN